MSSVKIEILKKAKDFSIDEVHGFLKVLKFPTKMLYEKLSVQDYLSTAISSVDDIDKLQTLLDSFNSELDESASNIKWREGHYKVFISHRSEYKKKVNDLKERLFYFGIHGFVAHEDIDVSSQWRDSLVGALKTSNAVLAYITDDFEDNSWCLQEIGYACIAGLKIVPLKISDKNPSGFLGFYQAANGKGKSDLDLATLVATKILENDFNNYFEYLLLALKHEPNFSKTKYIQELLVNSNISISNEWMKKLEDIVASDYQIYGYGKSDEYMKKIRQLVR